MIHRIAMQLYELQSSDSFGIRVDEIGTRFQVEGAIDDTRLKFASGGTVSITPTMLSGVRAHHTVTLFLIWDVGATPTAIYTITVLDPAGGVVDTIQRTNPGGTLPQARRLELSLLVT